jgi:hypothetical protein
MERRVGESVAGDTVVAMIGSCELMGQDEPMYYHRLLSEVRLALHVIEFSTLGRFGDGVRRLFLFVLLLFGGNDSMIVGFWLAIDVAPIF